MVRLCSESFKKYPALSFPQGEILKIPPFSRDKDFSSLMFLEMT